MLPRCQKCGTTTGPIPQDHPLQFAVMPGLAGWVCPACGFGFVRPLTPEQASALAALARRTRKRWWQFWK